MKMRLLVVVLFVFVLSVKALKEEQQDMNQDPLEDDDHSKPLDKRFFKCGLYNPWKHGCCNGQLYVRKTHGCCKKKVIKKLVCGSARYNSCSHGCCKKGNSAVVFSRRWRKCCSGKVQWKIFNKHCGPLLHG